MPKFGIIPPEPPRIVTLELCAPSLQVAVPKILADMRANGRPAMIAESMRTPERQHWLFGFGRLYDDDRGIVTNADDFLSGWHPLGLAVDFWSVADEWRAPGAFWQLLYEVGARYGMRAGIHIRPGGGDRPHLQWYKCAPSPTWRSRVLYRSGGVKAIWRAVGAMDAAA